ncbi:MAG: carboxylating nicotinate-nucleotide diphosphorylase [Microcystaceae cyanobacterium]
MLSLPPWIILDPLLQTWLQEDIGRGDRTTQALFYGQIRSGEAIWIAKAEGMIAGLPIAARIFRLLNPDTQFIPLVAEGEIVKVGQTLATIKGELGSLLTGERVALNLAMRLSGIATLTQKYSQEIAGLPTQFVDTRKTTPGHRILEKYATQLGGATNHRMGLDDAVMIKDNHIQAAGGIKEAITKIRQNIPYPLTIEVETSTLIEVQEALDNQADIIMLDNMSLEEMEKAVKLIRETNDKIKIEASGNITLKNISSVAQTGVDYISSSATITQAKWLDISMRDLQVFSK